MKAAAAERVPFDLRREGPLVAAWTALGIALRALFVVLQTTPQFDPWRHLALIRNLREGAGFTLFDAQPYLWYAPLWHRLCAALPPAIGPELLSAAFSAATVPLAYVVARRRGDGPFAASVAALLFAAAGPMIRFTVHYGSEALALWLLLAALALAASRSGLAAAAIAGLLFGLALTLRLNFAFNVFLFLPWLASVRRGAAFGGAAALPLVWLAWRNARILAGHTWVFTWDGLAVRSADFNALSTLVVQMQPDVSAALRRLHEQIVPSPEWLRAADGSIAWMPLAFLAACLAALLIGRRMAELAAALPALAYFLLLDGSLSANFFRIYLALFPACFLAAAAVAERTHRTGRGAPAALLAATIVVAGAPLYAPAPMLTLEQATPPERLLDAPRYLVNSGRYHPESLIWRYPDRSFLGLPLRPEQFAEFSAAHPDLPVLWHGFSVQPELQQALTERFGYAEEMAAINGAGTIYRVLRAGPQRGQLE